MFLNPLHVFGGDLLSGILSHPKARAELLLLLTVIQNRVGVIRAVLAEPATVQPPPPPVPKPSRWITPQEAADRMGVSVKWLQRRRKTLDFVVQIPDGRGWRIHEERFEEWLAKRR